MEKEIVWHNLKVWDKTYHTLRLMAAMKGTTLSFLMDELVESEMLNSFGADETTWPSELRKIREME